MIPELLRNDTCIANVLKFSLHAVTLLSQLDPKDFPHLINKNSIAESYRGFFQIFGGNHVNILFSGFQDYFQTLTKLFIFDDSLWIIIDHHHLTFYYGLYACILQLVWTDLSLGVTD